MNCQEAQLQLSAYLERSLDAVRMKSIENHLLSCPFCRAESHALANCINQIADLPLLDPPEGFAGRIMARAREIENEPVFWRRLTGAFQNPLPIQAAAVVLVSVLAVFLYQKNGGFKALAPERLPPAVSQPPSVSTESSAPQTAAAPAEKAAQPPRARAEAQESSSTSRRESAATASAKRTATPRAPAATESVTSETAMPEAPVAPKRRAIQAQEVSTGNDTHPGADALSIGAAIGALNRSAIGRSPFRADNALSPLSNPSADYEFLVKRRPKERREASEGATTDAAASRSGVAAPGALSAAINPPVEIRWFTVLPEHYDEFRKELAAEAIIDAEKSTASKDEFGFNRPRELLIKVTILPADR